MNERLDVAEPKCELLGKEFFMISDLSAAEKFEIRKELS